MLTHNPIPDRSEELRHILYESDVNAKIEEVRRRLSTKEGASKFIYDYEPDLADILAALARFEPLEASIACDKLIIRQAENEVEREWS